MKTTKNKKKEAVNKGVWLDEKDAIIITVSKGEGTLKKISSEVGKCQPSENWKSASPRSTKKDVSENTYPTHRKIQLKKYYRAIIKDLKKASNLYILGPAIAKMNLFKEICQSKKLKFEDINIQTSDKLTCNQLKQKVCEYFKDKIN